MQNKLENTEKEVILLKQELSKNEKELVNFKNDLIQQMKNEMVQLKNVLSDTNKLLIKEIEKVNDKSIEESKNMEQLNNNLQQQIKLSVHQVNKDIGLPFVFIINDEKIKTHYHNDEKLLYYHRDGYGACCYHLLKDLKIKGSYYTYLIYERIVIPPGKVLISIEVNVYLKIYNKGIHDNIKTGELIILINEKDINNILDLCKKEPMIKNLNITHVLSKCLKE